MRDFPKEIKLIDTGIRRFPTYNEYYLWISQYDDSLNGPCILYKEEADTNDINVDNQPFFGTLDPSYFSIYRVEF